MRYPSFSPDGENILFSSGTNKDSEIWIVTTDGEEKKRLAKGGYPSLSPDGKKILYVSEMNKDSDIWVMNSKKRMLTKGKYPQFSPDGSKILFFRSNKKKHPLFFQLFIMNQDGTEIKKLTEEDESAKIPAWYSGPIFSPDSKKIVFSFNPYYKS